MTSAYDEDVLRGKTLRVYRYVLKKGKPVGVREVQRALKFSSPRLAFYHLNKLEETGFLRKTVNGYMVDRVFLKQSIRLMGLLVPRYFFYSVFFMTALVMQLTLFRPSMLRADFIFGLAVISIAAIFFLYEALRIMHRKGL